jgi:Polysaccharide biosynthesis protein C-terminal
MDYTSHNTRILDMKEIKTILAGLDIIQDFRRA